MQKPEKKKSKRLPRRLPLMIAAVLAVCCAAFFWRAANKPNDAPVKVTEAAQEAVFSSRAVTELKKVTVSSPKGETYTLLVTDGQATLSGDADFTFSDTWLTPILEYAAEVSACETLLPALPDAETLSAMGLSPALLTVEIEYTDGQTLSYAMGAALPVSDTDTPPRYMTVGEDGALYADYDERFAAYNRTLQSLRAFTQLSVNADLIDQITIVRTGEDTLALEKRADGWHILSPAAYPADDAKVETLLNSLAGMRYASYSGAGDLTGGAETILTLVYAPSVITGYDESDQPLFTQDVPAATAEYRLGESADGVMIPCFDGESTCLATSLSTAFLTKIDSSSYYLRSPVNYQTNRLTTLSISKDGQSADFSILLRERVLENNALETDDDGNVLYDVIPLRDGREGDSLAFLRAYALLTKLAPAGSLPDGWTQTDAQAVLKLNTESASREVAFLPYGKLHYALRVDGVCLYYMLKEDVDAAIDAMMEI